MKSGSWFAGLMDWCGVSGVEVGVWPLRVFDLREEIEAFIEANKDRLSWDKTPGGSDAQAQEPADFERARKQAENDARARKEAESRAPGHVTSRK